MKTKQAHRPAGEARVTELYRSYGRIIYSRCRRLLNDDALAQDATQEVFVRVMRHLDAAPTDRTALAWIYRISTNYCLNLIRDRARLPEPVAQLPEVAGEDAETTAGEHQLAQVFLDRVPEKLRAPVVLRYRDGLEHQEIAAELGVSRRTVINRLNDFLAQSRQLAAAEA